MSACDPLVRGASAGVAASLRAVDCVSAEATASAFSRLFGAHGALLPALTILLTIYVASFAILLLTGRATLSIGNLTPRMVTLGLVLTFTTSWLAYQGVVWNLAMGAADQIAGVLIGASGSATQLFADRIDILFNAIAETAAATSKGAGSGATSGAFTAGNLMWLSAMLLLLGTVGVLVTARIALAMLLGLGPVFIALALFNGTRGLFAGWLKAVALMALTPLFAIIGGALMVEMAAPVVAALRGGTAGIDGRAAMALFVIAFVYCAIMTLALRVASTMVGGWRVFGLLEIGDRPGRPGRAESVAAPPGTITPPASAASSPRVRNLISGLSAPGAPGRAPAAANAAAGHRNLRDVVAPAASGSAPGLSQHRRARGVGSRFANPSRAQREVRR